MHGFSKDEVAERLYCSLRSLERIEFENAAPNKDTAIKEVRKLSEINIKAFADINTRIPIINESDGWFNWYYGLIVGKLYKVAVSHECMGSCLSNCLSEVIVKKDQMYYFDNTSDPMFLGQINICVL